MIQLTQKFIKNIILQMIKIYFIFFLTLIYNSVCADEIIRDSKGNYYLMKEDGKFEKLPPPKPGNKYIIKKKVVNKKVVKKKIFKKPDKSARVRTNQGFR